MAKFNLAKDFLWTLLVMSRDRDRVVLKSASGLGEYRVIGPKSHAHAKEIGTLTNNDHCRLVLHERDHTITFCCMLDSEYDKLARKTKRLAYNLDQVEFV